MPTLTNALITAHPSASQGQVRTLDLYSESDFTRGDLILCRNTAPLVSFAYALLHRDVPCRILGRDIGASLIFIVKKMRAFTIPDLRDKLSIWREREVLRCAGEGRDPQKIEDQHSCLLFFVNSLDEDSQSVASLIAKIELMFTDDAASASSRVTLATIHKSKGLEFHRVFILDRSLIPSRYAKQPWQLEQERNLLYVAITRAMESLTYIASDSWKENNNKH